MKTNRCLNGQWISHTFLPDKSYSRIFLERIWLRAAVQFQISTYRWFSQHSSRISFQTWIESLGENLSQNPERCTNNASWGHNILLRCCWRRTILFHTGRCWRLDWRTKLWKEKAISEKADRMGSTWETILSEANYQRIHKDWRKHYVALHKRNRGNCTATSKKRCRSVLRKFRTPNIWSNTWRSAIDNRQNI